MKRCCQTCGFGWKLGRGFVCKEPSSILFERGRKVRADEWCDKYKPNPYIKEDQLED